MRSATESRIERRGPDHPWDAPVPEIKMELCQSITGRCYHHRRCSHPRNRTAPGQSRPLPRLALAPSPSCSATPTVLRVAYKRALLTHPMHSVKLLVPPARDRIGVGSWVEGLGAWLLGMGGCWLCLWLGACSLAWWRCEGGLPHKGRPL